MKMKSLSFLLLISLISGGCTNSLQSAARGTLVSLDASQVKLTVVSARIDRVVDTSNGSSFKAINICVKKATDDEKSSSVQAIVILYPKYAVPPVLFHEENGVLVIRARDATIKPNCGTQKIYYTGSRLEVLKDLPIITVAENARVALDKDVDEAVYVAYENGTIKSLGYVSARPFFTSRYSFGVDLSGSIFFTEYRDKKPFLLLFAPLTAAADLSAGSVLMGVMAVSCGTQLTGCK